MKNKITSDERRTKNPRAFRPGSVKATYPDNWPEIAKRIKDEACWCCERCGHVHDVESGHVLTVHHLTEEKHNCEDWNLAALCQRCHLKIQGRVRFLNDYFLPHTPWMLKHVLAYNAWAKVHGKPLLTVTMPIPMPSDLRIREFPKVEVAKI